MLFHRGTFCCPLSTHFISRLLHYLSFICRWVREFLNDENKGLDVLVDYLSFAQCSVM